MANQINIDIGAAANDGTGDPLRTAFNYVNLNFANVWATGLPNSNVQFNNNRVLTVNTNANLVLAPNGTGIVQSNVSILPNTDRVHNLGSAGKKWDSIYANYLNISDLDIDADLVVGGNLTVEGNTIQIGNIVTDTKTIQLANTANTTAAANGSGITVGVNDNIATLLYSSASNVWTTNIGISAVGNITAGNISVTDSVNITQNLNAKTGTFTGDAAGDNSIYAGFPTFTVLGSDVVAQFSGNTDAYIQFNFQNGSAGNQASGDYVITADNGNDTTHFLNIGLTGSNWDGSQPNSLNSRLGPNDGYMYVQDGNLAIGVKNGNVTDWIWRFDITGSVTADGNLIPSANGVYSLGNSTNYWANVWVANNTMYIGGVPVGMTAGNVLTVNGNAVLTNGSNTTISTTGNITANYFLGNTQGSVGNITNLDSLNFNVENISALVGNNGVNIGAGGFNNLVVLPTDVLIQNVPLTVAGNIISTVAGGLYITANTVANGTAQIWNFGTDGRLTFPGTPRIDTDANNFEVQAAESISLEANAVVNIYTDTSGTAYQWQFGNDGNLTLPTNRSIIVDGGDGVIGPVSDDMVISWDNEELILRSIAGGIEAQADADFRIKTGYDVGSGDYLYKWIFTNNDELVNITGDSTILTEAGNLNLQGGRNTLSSGNVQITAVDNGVSVNVWTFDNTGNLTSPGNIITTGNVSGNTAGYAIGYRDIPQVSFTGNATITTTDAGKHFYSTQSTDYILTIANNASQGFQTGAAITIVNQGTGNITVAQGSGVTLYLAGNATSGNRTLATFGMATIMKVATDTWFINGTGVS